MGDARLTWHTPAAYGYSKFVTLELDACSACRGKGPNGSMRFAVEKE